jgi:hypothetical protein
MRSILVMFDPPYITNASTAYDPITISYTPSPFTSPAALTELPIPAPEPE